MITPIGTYLSSCQDDSILINRGIAYSILRDTKQALAGFDLAIELNPHSAPSYFNLSNLHYSMGDHSRAELDYKKGDYYIVSYYNTITSIIIEKEGEYPTSL